MATHSSESLTLEESVEKFQALISEEDKEKVGDVNEALVQTKVQSKRDLKQAFGVFKDLAVSLVDRHGPVGALGVVEETVQEEGPGDKSWYIFGLLMAVAIAAVVGSTYVFRRAILAFLAELWPFVAPFGGWLILIGTTAAGAYLVAKYFLNDPKHPT